MWRPRFLAGLLIVAALFCAAGQVHAQIQAFLLPESNFLRVEGELAIAPTSPRFSLRLFPNAQITALWTEGIADYTVDRGLLGTLVTVRLNDYGSEKMLYLGYEGFVDYGAEDPLILDRDRLWFPEFSIPTAEPELELIVPEGWYRLEVYNPGYPTVVLSRDSEMEWELDLALQPVEPEVEHSPLLPSEPEPELELEPEPLPLPSPSQQEVALTVIPDALYDEVSNLVLRLDTAISQRDEALLRELVGQELQADGLVDYFTAAPQQILPVESQIRTLVVEGAEGYVEATIFSRGQPLYDTEMHWAGDGLGSWVLTEFSMHPHTPSAPQALLDSLRGFADQLQRAVATGSAPHIEELVGITDPQERAAAVKLLMDLNTAEPWEVFVVEPHQFRLLTLIRHSPRTHVAASLRLMPDPTGWRIAALEALPVN